MAPSELLIWLGLLASLALSSCSDSAEQDYSLGYCGLSPYDITNETIRRYQLNVSDLLEVAEFRRRHVPQMYRLDPAKDPVLLGASKGWRNKWTKDQRGLAVRLRQLRLTLMPVRLRILYDETMAARYPTRKSIESFVRNLMLSVQMIFEQPELYERVKLQLVITEIARLDRELPPEMTADVILDHMDEYNPTGRPRRHDLSVLLLARSIHEISKRGYGAWLVGLAGMGAFCSAPDYRLRGLLAQTEQVNRVITMAHELAHTFGVPHDGQPGVNCEDGAFVMSRMEKPGRVKWSSCSVGIMENFFLGPNVFKCAYDPARLTDAAPMSAKFDWRPGQPAREPLPGQEWSAERQCQLATESSAARQVHPEPAPNTLEVCQQVNCELDGNHYPLGPALPGTECFTKSQNRRSICLWGVCASVTDRPPPPPPPARPSSRVNSTINRSNN